MYTVYVIYIYITIICYERWFNLLKLFPANVRIKVTNIYINIWALEISFVEL